MEKRIVFYHDNCPDGFGAAWSFWRKFGSEAEYYPARHTEPITKDLTDYEVYVADFCFSLEKINEIAKVAKSLIILDHHKTSYETCKDSKYCYFDMNKSGAVLSWEYCFPNVKLPKLLEYIQDRDLFLNKQKFHERVITYIDSFEKTFETWNFLHEQLEKDLSIATTFGAEQLKYRNSMIKILKQNIHILEIAGHKVKAINTAIFGHEIACEVATTEPFVAYYYFTNNKKIKIGLRSRESNMNSIDVSEVAKLFGGGGHKHAAAFQVNSFDELELK